MEQMALEAERRRLEAEERARIEQEALEQEAARVREAELRAQQEKERAAEEAARQREAARLAAEEEDRRVAELERSVSQKSNSLIGSLTLTLCLSTF